jgi:hypothetical protein
MKELCRLNPCTFGLHRLVINPCLVAQAPLNKRKETHRYAEYQRHHPCGHLSSRNMLVAGCKRFFLSRSHNVHGLKMRPSGFGEVSLTNLRQKLRHVLRHFKTRSCNSSMTPTMPLLQLVRKFVREDSPPLLNYDPSISPLERSRSDSAKVKLTPPTHETVTAPQEPRHAREQSLNHSSKPATYCKASKQKKMFKIPPRMVSPWPHAGPMLSSFRCWLSTSSSS